MSHRTRERRRRSHTDSGQQALLALATRRSTTPAVDPDDELTTIVISTGPAVTYRIPDPPHHAAAPRAKHPLGTPAPLALGHVHADVVLAELLAAAAEVEHPPAPTPVPTPVTEHVVHHQLPHGAQLCTVPLVDPDAALADEVELLIARFACAVSDLAVRPGGVHALAMLLVPYTDRPLSTWDHRPLGAAVGYELGEVA